LNLVISWLLKQNLRGESSPLYFLIIGVSKMVLYYMGKLYKMKRGILEENGETMKVTILAILAENTDETKLIFSGNTIMDFLQDPELWEDLQVEQVTCFHP